MEREAKPVAWIADPKSALMFENWELSIEMMPPSVVIPAWQSQRMLREEARVRIGTNSFV